MIFLTHPSPKYKQTFLEGVREFQREGRLHFYNIRRISDDFEEFLQQVLDQKDQKKTTPYRVPTTDFWLIDGDEYVGQLSLRHELNDFLNRVAGHIGYQIRPARRRQGYGKEILRLGLEKAREMGLPRALVTCDENNIGSKKIIEHNGGKFENAVDVEGSPVKKLRYWIDLR